MVASSAMGKMSKTTWYVWERVCVRERGRETEIEIDRERDGSNCIDGKGLGDNMVCGCLCVFVRNLLSPSRLSGAGHICVELCA